MLYKIIIEEAKGKKLTKIIVDPPNEALNIYINTIDKYLVPIFLEYHILLISFPQELGVINYYKNLDWEDLEYIRIKFGAINDRYIYIYTYTGRVIDTIMLKFEFDEMYYYYVKTIYESLIGKDFSEIQKRYSEHINWWLNSHLNDPYGFHTDQIRIYQNLNISWKSAMEEGLNKLKKIIEK